MKIKRITCPIGEPFKAPFNTTFASVAKLGGIVPVLFCFEEDEDDEIYRVEATGVEFVDEDWVLESTIPNGENHLHLLRRN